MANLKHANVVQCNVHQEEVEAHRAEIKSLIHEHTAQLEAKVSFNAVEKFCALVGLQADYQAKLLALYDE